MKRNGQMQRAGIPKAGMRPGHFHGFRRPHWRETRTLIGRHENGLPIFKYTPEPVHVIRPAWHAKRAAGESND